MLGAEALSDRGADLLHKVGCIRHRPRVATLERQRTTAEAGNEGHGPTRICTTSLRISSQSADDEVTGAHDRPSAA